MHDCVALNFDHLFLQAVALDFDHLFLQAVALDDSDVTVWYFKF